MIQSVEYLEENTYQLDLPNTNNNIKILRYKLGGRSYYASLVQYVFDPWILKLDEGMPKQMVQFEDYAPDDAVICLEELKTTKTLIALN